MRAVVQRVKESRVEVKKRVVGRIGSGLLILLGVGEDDTKKDCEYLAGKIANLRIFSDEKGFMNLSLLDTGGACPGGEPVYPSWGLPERPQTFICKSRAAGYGQSAL
jgi:hypothetical protein